MRKPLRIRSIRDVQGRVAFWFSYCLGAVHAALFIKRDSEDRNSVHVGVITHPIRLHFDMLEIFEHLFVR